jgi:hypothetical protein
MTFIYCSDNQDQEEELEEIDCNAAETGYEPESSEESDFDFEKD